MLALNFTGCIPYNIIRSGFVISSYTLPSNKTFVDFYFKEHPELEHVWVCRCGMSRKQNRKLRGHGNLMEHITRHHKNYLSEFRDGSKLAAVFQNVSDKARNIHAWLDWTCTGLPFNFCEKDSTKKYTSLSPICSKTSVTYFSVKPSISCPIIEVLFQPKILKVSCSCISTKNFGDPEPFNASSPRKKTNEKIKWHLMHLFNVG